MDLGGLGGVLEVAAPGADLEVGRVQVAGPREVVAPSEGVDPVVVPH